jgi:hypothetical protein
MYDADVGAGGKKQGYGCYSGSVGLRLEKRSGRFAIFGSESLVRGRVLNKSHGGYASTQGSGVRVSQKQMLCVCVCLEC